MRASLNDAAVKGGEEDGVSGVLEESNPVLPLAKENPLSLNDHLSRVHVPDEPADGTRIQMRMPDGTMLVRNFSPLDPVRTIYAFLAVRNSYVIARSFRVGCIVADVSRDDSAQTLCLIISDLQQSTQEAFGGREFVLSTGSPPKDLINDIDNTIEACGLQGGQQLITVYCANAADIHHREEDNVGDDTAAAPKEHSFQFRKPTFQYEQAQPIRNGLQQWNVGDPLLLGQSPLVASGSSTSKQPGDTDDGAIENEQVQLPTRGFLAPADQPAELAGHLWEEKEELFSSKPHDDPVRGIIPSSNHQNSEQHGDKKNATEVEESERESSEMVTTSAMEVEESRRERSEVATTSRLFPRGNQQQVGTRIAKRMETQQKQSMTAAAAAAAAGTNSQQEEQRSSDASSRDCTVAGKEGKGSTTPLVDDDGSFFFVRASAIRTVPEFLTAARFSKVIQHYQPGNRSESIIFGRTSGSKRSRPRVSSLQTANGPANQATDESLFILNFRSVAFTG